MQASPRVPWTSVATAALAVVLGACGPTRRPAPAPGPSAPRPSIGGTIRVALPDGGSLRDLRSRLIAGPFAASGGRLVAAADGGGGPPWADAVELVAAGDEAPLLLSLGEADVALARGAGVEAVAGLPGVRLTRVAALDRVYVLWLSGSGRFLRDPGVRAAVAAGVDRAALARFALAGRGAPVRSLVGVESDAVDDVPDVRRRRAELVLRLAADDAVARELSTRLRETWRLAGVDVELRPVDADVVAGPDELALLAVSAAVPDDVALAGLLEGRPDDAAAGRALELLRRGDPPDLAEYELRMAQRLVPLVRAEAWAASREGAVAGGPADAPDLGIPSMWVPR